MKNVIVTSDPPSWVRAEIEDIPYLTFNDDQLLIQVVVAGANPKDWKHPGPAYFNSRLNQGDDIAGTVHAVGKNVNGFTVGDRVAAFHQMNTKGGGYAEVAVVHKQSVFLIPESLSFEEAATIPLADIAYTAAVGLFRILQLPSPWDKVSKPTPLIINGASSAVGAFALKLAKLNPSITPIIGIAGASADFARSVGYDVVLDYRSPTISGDLSQALSDKICRHVFDASASVESAIYISSAVGKNDAKYTCTTGIQDGQKKYLEAFAEYRQIWVGCVHEDKEHGAKDFGFIWAAMFGRLLHEKRLTGHPFEVVPEGLRGVEGALQRLMNRKSGNEKFVFRIAETPDGSSEK